MNVVIDSNIRQVMERVSMAAASVPLALETHQLRAAVAARDLLVEAVKAATPRATGELADSTGGSLTQPQQSTTLITVNQRKTVYWRAKGIDYPLVRLLVDGTSAHDIVPFAKKALYWPGAAHPVRRVHIPARAGINYPQQAVDRVYPAIFLLANRAAVAAGEDVLGVL